MNTISSSGQIMAMDGGAVRSSAFPAAPSAGKERDFSSVLNIPDASKVAESIVQSAAAVKADAQHLQKMTDLVMGRKLRFNVNNELGSIVVKIIDPNTEQVIKEIPSEDIQKLKIRIRQTIGVLFDELI
ncbi:MAG: flagellar protein FlaG [Treponemataceae bacterium]|nr:flagellar protein FlaG [Treponemataceae bacterium]